MPRLMLDNRPLRQRNTTMTSRAGLAALARVHQSIVRNLATGGRA